MYKEIELGCSVPETGEPRVRYLDRNDSLVKTASEIQRFWDTLGKNDEYAYLWVIGVSAMEYYGCNNNGDAFHEEDLKNTYQDFVSNAYIYLHHVNKDPKRSIGRPIYAWYNDDMHRVELVLAIKRDAEGAQAIVERIKNGEQMYVSMGCKVKFDVCSICGHQAKTRALYCDHLKYNLKKILPDGRQVYAINPNPKFFDISMVTRPADPTAFALDKIAEQHGYRKEPNALLKEASLYASDFRSSVDGEDVRMLSDSLHKTADILKEVNGRIVDSKFPDQVTAVKDIAEQGFDKIDYPHDLDYPALERLGTSPVGLVRVMGSMGAPLSFGDMYWASGLSGMDVPRHRIFAALPSVMHSVAERPSLISRILEMFRNSYNGELEEPVKRTLIIRITMPVATARSEFVSGLMKTAAAIDRGVDMFGKPYSKNSNLSGNRIYGYDRNFAQIKVRDRYGREATTTPYDISNAHPFIPNRYDDDKLRGTAMVKGLGLNDLVEHFAVTVGLASCKPVMEKSTVLEDVHRVDKPEQRNEVPVNLVMESDHQYVKTAGWFFNKKPQQALTPEQAQAVAQKNAVAKANKLPWWKCRAGTLLGAGIPAALMLDYKYNQMKGTDFETEDTWHNRLLRAGKFINDHPIATIGVGSMVGSRLPV